MAIIKTDAFKCERCGHVWISEKYTPENLPIACAKCKSPYWNRPRKSETRSRESGIEITDIGTTRSN